MSVRPAVRDGLAAGLLLAVTAGLAVLTGQPLVFPSLGPTAYVLARTPTAGTTRRVVGGHAIGVAAGVLAYRLLAPGLVVTGSLPPLGEATLRLGAAAVLSVGLTAAGMVAADAEHAPACATTLICALGLLRTPLEAGGILVSVVVLLGSYRLLTRFV
ncbi:HPP family protein [Salinirubellus salinus]|uniref:HPP family protein n=1 Tax=Salinirubellus salinus TaxID=1364945 RepID=A0A9E7R6T4_9EURY|nr:HPP family protein [Salinirubellus salinus]UWM55735.1 HPP family protein [Salinirubellus salinus]